eukprot:TRINITY_DN1425_c3_g2_i1.p1 TRINITY_DN1425_c3_g2~~TRINITY_DN1425_c3_g2_i1.p1  ORF type:complete len:260 (+),score=52.10 TRINITY_DN1425_c3_g2_i1:51-782(+)
MTEGVVQPRNLSTVPSVRDAVLVKGGLMTKIKIGGKEAKWDYALCSGMWFKIHHDSEKVAWKEEYNTIHSVEKCVANPKRLMVWWFNGKEGGHPKLACRELQVDNEGDRDDWVLTFKSLLTNYWHERLEATLIPAPEIYQFHLFVTVGADTTPHLLILSTTAFRVAKLPQPSESVLVSKCLFSALQGIQRKESSPTSLLICFNDGQSQLAISTKDSVESLLVIAEINRLVRMNTGKLIATEVK